MNELSIKTHDFELAKKRLKEFSQKKADELDIDTVRTDGGFLGLGNHKVTGYELNERLSIIQEHLIDLNNTNNKTIKEFGQVYSALEALDKDYIQAILISIKATEKTSERIQTTQDQIKKIVDDQKKTLEVLKKFKQKLDGYAHLGDIDKIWIDFHKCYNEIATLSNSIDSTMVITKANAQKVEDLETILNTSEKKINDLSNQLNQQIEELEAIISFISELEQIVHLQDIDGMWDSIKLNSSQLSELEKQSDKTNRIVQTNKESTDAAIASVIEKNNTDIQMLTKKINDLSNQLNQQIEKLEAMISFISELEQIVHLQDIDEMWDSIELNSSQLSELEKQSDKTNSIVQTNKESTDAAIASVIEKNNTDIQMLTKKIKYAYILAGGSLGLAIIELIMILLKVI